MLSIFDPVFNLGANAQASSNVWQAQADGTATVSAGTIVKNDQPQGTSCNYVTDDILYIQTQAPSANNTTAFITYTLGNRTGVWSVATANVDEYPFQFSFVGTSGAQPGAVIKTPPFILDRLINAVSVNVGSVLNARLYKNGQDVGIGTQAFNGDSIELEFTVHDKFDSLAYVPVSVGAYVDRCYVQTLPKDLHPAIPVFAPITNAGFAQVVESNAYTVAGIDASISASAENATLVVNGNPVSGSVQVVSGDVLKLRMTSGTYSLDTTHAKLVLGDVEVSWTVVVGEVADHYRVTPNNFDRHLFDNGADFVPDNASNSVCVLNPTTNTFTSYALSASPTNAEDEADHLFVSSFYEDCLYVLSATGQQVLFKRDFETGAKPYGLAYAPPEFEGEQIAYKFVSLYGADKVVQLDPENAYAIVAEFAVEKPLGIAADKLGRVYVACENGNLVSLLPDENYTYALGEPERIGTSLLEAVAGDGGDVYVGDYHAGAVYRCVNGSVVDTFSAGINPIGLAFHAGHLYSCDSAENTITKTNVSTREQTKIKTLSYPSGCAVDKDDTLWISHLGTNKVLEVTSAGVRTEVVVHKAYGVSIANDKVVAVRLYGNVPSRTAAESRVHSVESKTIQPATKTTLFSQIERTRRKSLVTLPSVYGTTLYKNGQNVGNSTYVGTDDVVTVSAYSHAGHVETSTIYMTVDGVIAQVSISTSEDITPDSMFFGGAFNQFMGDVSISGEATISGMTEGATTTLSYDNAGGSIILNGNEVGLSAVVRNGDRIKLKTVAEGVYGQSFLYSLTQDSTVVGTFRIQSIVLNGPMRNEQLETYQELAGVEFDKDVSEAIELHSTSRVVMLEASLVETLGMGMRVDADTLYKVDARGYAQMLESTLAEADAYVYAFDTSSVAVAEGLDAVIQPYVKLGTSLQFGCDFDRHSVLVVGPNLHAGQLPTYEPLLLDQEKLDPKKDFANTLLADMVVQRHALLADHLVGRTFHAYSSYHEERVGVEFDRPSGVVRSHKPQLIVYTLGKSLDVQPIYLEHAHWPAFGVIPQYMEHTHWPAFGVIPQYMEHAHWPAFGVIPQYMEHTHWPAFGVIPQYMEHTHWPAFGVIPEYMEHTKIHTEQSSCGQTRNVAQHRLTQRPNSIRNAPTSLRTSSISYKQWSSDVYGINTQASVSVPVYHKINTVYIKELNVLQDNGDVPTGLYSESELAMIACQTYGDGVCSVQRFADEWTWKTEPDSNIVCVVPTDDSIKIPVAGWISGG